MAAIIGTALISIVILFLKAKKKNILWDRCH